MKKNIFRNISEATGTGAVGTFAPGAANKAVAKTLRVFGHAATKLLYDNSTGLSLEEKEAAREETNNKVDFISSKAGEATEFVTKGLMSFVTKATEVIADAIDEENNRIG